MLSQTPYQQLVAHAAARPPKNLHALPCSIALTDFLHGFTSYLNAPSDSIQYRPPGSKLTTAPLPMREAFKRNVTAAGIDRMTVRLSLLLGKSTVSLDISTQALPPASANSPQFTVHATLCGGSPLLQHTITEPADTNIAYTSLMTAIKDSLS